MERSRKIWKVLRWLLLIGACLFVIAQFYRPAKTNPAVEPSLALEAHMQLDPKVTTIFDRSCIDCHSNKTRWPWYSNVAPMSWFVIDHVDHGRSHMNFSEWGSYDAKRKSQLLNQSCVEVKAGAMPLSSYTPLHPGSKLTMQDVSVICEWAANENLRLR
jgi:hypothetical protein